MARPKPFELVLELAGASRFVNALTVAAIGTAVLSTALQRTIGAAGLIAILSTLGVLAVVSLIARRDSITWLTILPFSLLVFLGWAALSIFWSSYQWATFWGLGYLAIYTLLGIYIALVRDLIQIVRAFGDVLRFVLASSIALEIVSGLLIDAPIRFLGIEGKLATLGPIQGLLGTRNQIALISLIALITFATELRTRSISRGLAIGSISLALLVLALSRSPVMGAVFLIVGAAAAALYGIRRVPAARRTAWQLVLLGALLVGVIVAWALRTQLISLFSASGDLDYRLNVWRGLWDLIPVHPVEGWGWTGYWQSYLTPFTSFAPSGSVRVPTSATNAFIDVWFQLGLVGIAIFVGMVGLTFVRSWLLAGQRRSIVFAWPALVLVVLILTGLTESSLLVEYGWLTFVVCCVKAASELSWRRAFARPLEPEPLD